MRSLQPRIPPPLVTLAAALVMWLVAWAVPSMRLAIHLPMLAVAIAVAGLIVVLAGVAQFRRASTTVNPLNPAAASSLVVTGVYRFTRNPMYLGFASILLAWAIFLSNPLCLLVLPAFVAYMNRFQIMPEERALRALFPGDFEAYRSLVRRWL